MDRKHVLIGGGSGFVGRALTAALEARGDRVTIVSREPGPGRITWEALDANGLPQCDVVINLAGKHILDMRRRWNQHYRDELIRSRVDTTRALVKAINQSASPPQTFISTAGKCFYGSQGFHKEELYGDMHEWSTPVGVDYPASLVAIWEAAANEIDPERVRHVKVRLGIALSRDDKPAAHAGEGPGAYGVFPILRNVFKSGLVFRMGSGAQPFPWIHIDDVVGIFLQAIDDDAMEGIYNAVSPGIVSNKEFTGALAQKLGRWVLGSIPAWAIKAVVGVERSTILLLGQRVRPSRTVEAGYTFKFADLQACLDDLVGIQGGGQ